MAGQELKGKKPDTGFWILASGKNYWINVFRCRDFSFQVNTIDLFFTTESTEGHGVKAISFCFIIIRFFLCGFAALREKHVFAFHFCIYIKCFS